MAKKHAILIANTEYRDGKLAGLAHPGLAYAELADALKDPARGAFSQVETLVNANLSHVLNSLDRFFSRKPADDILLVYVGAHGFLDSQGELFLALKESDRFRLKSTALMAAVLGMNMDQCPSPHKLLILDCRFHSPYQDGRSGPGGPKVDPTRIFAGRGLPKQILLAAETAGIPANKVAAPAATSATQKLQVVAAKDFTRALAETLRTPSATGARAPFTVEDWWNAAAAEIKASKAEPPQRLAVGEPPLTILRGSSRLATMAMSSPGGETVVTMPVLPAEPEADWSRLSGIFPLEMFAPDLAPDQPADTRETLPEEDAGTVDTGRTAGGTEEMELPRGDQTLVADKSFIEGADLVLRARREIESATPADLSDPDAGTLESPLSTSPTLELPENPEAGEVPPESSRRPDATLFFDLRVPPDLSGDSTLLWDRPADDTVPAAPPAPPTPLSPRDTFTGLRARLQAQEEEENQARLKAEKEESVQREKLDQWKSRWVSRTGSKPAAAVPPEASTGPTSPTSPTPAASAPDKPKGYQAKIAALQKTMFVPGPDVDPEGTTPPQPLPDPSAETGRQESPAHPATPATPPIRDGLATVIVSKDQFLNTGVHRIPTELTPGATIRVSKEEFYGTGTPAGPVAADGSASEAGPRPARPIRAEGDAGRARRTGRIPKVPGRVPVRRRTLLWILAGLAPLGLGLFLFFGAKSGMLQALGIPGEEPSRGAEPPRTVRATPRPVLPAAPPDDPAPATGSEDILPPAAAAPATASAPATPSSPVTPSAKPAPSAAPVPSAPRASAPAASPRVQPPRPLPAPKLPAAAPDPAAQARARFRADSLKAAKFTRDSLAVFLALARKDSLKAARATRDSLRAVQALARKDSLRQARLVRDQERALKAEADAARLALARAKADSQKAIKDAEASEALLRRSVNQAFKADTEDMRGLYNRFALGYPGLKGEVVVNLLVAPSGEIERGVIQSSSTGVNMFDQLVLGNILEWKIQPFKSGKAKSILVAVNFPIE